MPNILVDDKEDDKEDKEEEESLFLALGPSLVIGSLSIASASIVSLG